MVSYSNFWKTLRHKEISQYKLIHQYHVSPSILDRMKKNEFISLRKVIDFCEILECDISDIVEYIPN